MANVVGRLFSSRNNHKNSAGDVGLSANGDSRIVVIERPGCHLCESALAALEPLAKKYGETIERKNLETDDELAKRWNLEIPVIAIDGALISVYRVDVKAVEKALGKKPNRS